MAGHVETRGMRQASCFRTVLWGLGSYAYPILGVIRSDALKRTDLMRNTIGPDVVLLNELALLGAFAEWLSRFFTCVGFLTSGVGVNIC
jgi:hypothetical protein